MRVDLHLPSDKATLAYVAGLFDGEGCVMAVPVTLSGGGISYDVKINIANTYYPLIEWLKETLGGSTAVQGSQNPRHKTCHKWQVTGKNAGLVLRAIMPWLHVKRRQAELAIEILNDHIPAHERYLGVSPLVIERQAARVAEIKSLNKRGVEE